MEYVVLGAITILSLAWSSALVMITMMMIREYKLMK